MLKKKHIVIRHIVVKESHSRACFVQSQYRYWFPRRTDPNIPNLIKPPWKVMIVQNFAEKLLYT